MSFEDNSYHTQFLRERVVAMIEDAKQLSKGKFEKTSQEMETFIYHQSSSRSEYMSIVASTIQYLKEQKGSTEETEKTHLNGETEESQAESSKESRAAAANTSDPTEGSPSTNTNV